MSNNIFGTASMPLIKVQDGMNGVPGKPGKDGATTYTWIKYANDINGNGISNSPVNKEYIGFAYNKATNVESNNPSDYAWSLIKGEDGTDGIDGAPGEDGKTTYTWIKYSSTEDGKEMTEIPDSNTKYIGIAVNKLEKVESTNPKDYTWSKFVGEDGRDGKNGVPGEPGADGRTPYFHTAWANSIDGKTDFTTSLPKENMLQGNTMVETTETREFVNNQLWDMAPGIEKYGINSKFTISLEIKAKKAGKVNIYSQNGSGTKYSMTNSPTIDVTTAYKKYSFVTSFTKYKETETKALLAFFGTYDTGVIPVVKNLKFEVGAEATPFLPPEREDIVLANKSYSHMGTYTDFIKEDSKNPDQYKWIDLSSTTAIGGRNYIRHSDTEVPYEAGTNGFLYQIVYEHLDINTTYTLSGHLIRKSAGIEKISVVGHTLGLNGQPNTPTFRNDVVVDSNGYFYTTFTTNDQPYVKLLVYCGLPGDTKGNSMILGRRKLEKGNRATDWTPAPEDSEEIISELEEGQKPENIWESLVTYPEFESLFDEKANAQDIEDLANAQSDFRQDLDGIQATMTQSQESMGEEINKMTSRLELNENKMEMRFAMSKGLNLIRNSTGWFNTDDWENTPNTISPETVGTRELEEFGLGHAFYLPSGKTTQELKQTVRVNPGETYTLSYWTKFHSTNNDHYQAVSIQIGGQKNILRLPAGQNQERYGRLEKSFEIPSGIKEVEIRMISGLAVEGYISGIMLNTGPDALQWSSHPEEIANTNIRMNLNGIRVEGANQYTIMSPDEFSGYANVLDEKTNTVSEERVFTLNGETTEVNRLKAEKTINLGSIIMQAIDSGEIQGIAFAGTD